MQKQEIILKRNKSFFKNADNYGYLFILPFFLVVLVFSIAPTVFTLFVSFTKWNNFSDMTFVGIENYIKVLKGGMFFKALYNTLKIMFIALPGCIILALVFAFLLEEKFRGFSRTFKTILFLPYITTPVAVGVLFGLIFDYQTGFLNIIMQKMGIVGDPIYWMSKPSYVVMIVALIVFWKNFGYTMFLYIAGLKAVPEELYEAADIDGANTLEKFLYIALPTVQPITVFIVITSVIWGLQIFDEPALLMVGTNQGLSIASTLGGPQKSIYTLVSYVYEEGFLLFREGMASAVSYLMTIVIAILSIVSLKLLNRGKEDTL